MNLLPGAALRSSLINVVTAIDMIDVYIDTCTYLICFNTKSLKRYFIQTHSESLTVVQICTG
jgi:hypothetical protein